MDRAAPAPVSTQPDPARADASSARARLERIYAKNPTSILFARLAEACLREGDVDHALSLCRRGLRYRPSYAAGHLVMASCHLQGGWLDGARDEFRKALHLDPDNLAALIGLSEVEALLGRPDAAVRCRARALALDPFHPRLRAPRDEDASPGRSPRPDLPDGEDGVGAEGSEGVSESSGSAASDLPFATVTLARLYAAQGHAGLARSTLQRVLRENPNHPEARTLLLSLEGGGRNT